MRKIRASNFVLLAISILLNPLFLSGCNAPKSNLKVFNNHFTTCDYAGAALFAEKKISGKEKPRGEDLLWTLQLGTIERIRRDYPKSTGCFDKSEEMLKYFDLQSEIGDTISSTMVNENIIPYRGEEYDGVMVNTYKGLNFMAEGKMDLARVEFNRALDRQRRAKEKFNEEINKVKREVEKKQQQCKYDMKSNVENPKTFQLLAQQYPNLYNFEAYPDFVNPLATYLAGVYFSLAGDHSKAVDLFKESYGMVKNNEYVAEDLRITEDILNGKGRPEKTIWLIFENGLGPEKKEFRLDIPLLLLTDNVKYVGIALPRLEFREKAYPYLVIESGGKEYKTCQVADMDRVIQTEFSKDFKTILTRAIISAVVKAAAQYALKEQGSSAGSMASYFMAAYSFATTAADVRIWTTLPKDFQVARFKKPENSKLRIIPAGSVPFDVNIPDCNNAIVYVKIPTSQAVPMYDVMRF